MRMSATQYRGRERCMTLDVSDSATILATRGGVRGLSSWFSERIDENVIASPSAQTLTPAASLKPKSDLTPPRSRRSRSSASPKWEGVSTVFLKQVLTDFDHHFRTLPKPQGVGSLDNISTAYACEHFVKVKSENGPFYTSVVRKQRAHSRSSIDPTATKDDWISPANVFVSHAWKYNFVDVLQQLISHGNTMMEMESKQCFFWIDVLMVDQTTALELPYSYWTSTFTSAIETIGTVLLLLSPWHTPIPTTRAWCMYELFTALASPHVRIQALLSESQKGALKEAIINDDNALMNAIVKLDVRNAECWVPRDREMIFAAIDTMDGGFDRMNTRINKFLRDWVTKALQEIVNADADEVGLHQDGDDNSVTITIKTQTMHEHGGGGDDVHPVHVVESSPLTVQSLSLSEHRRHQRSESVLENANDPHEANTTFTSNFTHTLHAITTDKQGEKLLAFATLCTNVGVVLESVGDYDAALAHHMKALAAREKVLGADHELTGDTCGNISDMYRSLGEFAVALVWSERHLRIITAAVGENHLKSANAYYGLGSLQSHLANYVESLKFYNKALAIREKCLESNDDLVASTYSSIGILWNKMADFPQALKCHKKAFGIWSHNHGNHHPRIASCLNNMGCVHQNQGNLRDALSCFVESVRVKEIVFGEQHSVTGIGHNNIGVTHAMMKNFTMALKSHETALGIKINAFDEQHPSVGTTRSNIALAHLSLHNYHEALHQGQLALEILSKSLGADHPTTAKCHNNLGRVYFEMENMDSAFVCFSTARTVYMASALGVDHVDVATSTFWLGNWYLKTGDLSTALGLHREAFTVRREALGDEHEHTLESKAVVLNIEGQL
eukprot:m.210416 g.210416  ORF g.210416 m.210416 type:complete len:847 (-) comp33077_c0_seq1:305-2845(-)